MDVSIVIPTWRGRPLLEEYLPSVIEAAGCYHLGSGAQFEIVVVEDAGGDDTAAWLEATYGGQVRIAIHPHNLGFCSACQTGFLQARFPIVLLLNNDVRLSRDCIKPLVEHFRNRDVFAVTGKILNQQGDVFCNGGKIGLFRRGMWSSYLNYDLDPSADKEDSYLSFMAVGAFSAYDRERFLAIGGFDQLTSMVEDLELSYRAWKRGWLIRYESRSVAFHDASQTMKRRYRRRALEMLSRRSRILMHWMLLHDRRMFARHVASLVGLLLTSWIWLDWTLYWAVFSGLRHIGQIGRKRVENRLKGVRSDRELLQLLEEFRESAPIVIR